MAIVLIVVVLAAAGGAAYFFVSKNKDAPDTFLRTDDGPATSKRDETPTPTPVATIEPPVAASAADAEPPAAAPVAKVDPPAVTEPAAPTPEPEDAPVAATPTPPEAEAEPEAEVAEDPADFDRFSTPGARVKKPVELKPFAPPVVVHDMELAGGAPVAPSVAEAAAPSGDEAPSADAVTTEAPVVASEPFAYGSLVAAETLTEEPTAAAAANEADEPVLADEPVVAEVEAVVEPEPVVEEEPEPVVAEVEAVVEPEPVVEEEPEPVVAEVEAVVEPEPVVAPAATTEPDEVIVLTDPPAVPAEAEPVAAAAAEAPRDAVDHVLQALIGRAQERKVALAQVAAELVEQANLEDREIDEVLGDLIAVAPEERENVDPNERLEELTMFNDAVPKRPGQINAFDSLGASEKKRVIIRVLCLLVALQEDYRLQPAEPASEAETRSWPLARAVWPVKAKADGEDSDEDLKPIQRRKTKLAKTR